MSPVLQTDPKTPMDGGRSRLAERLATGSDDCEDQLHVGDDLPRFSEIDVDWASAANFEGCGAPISPAPEDARGELEQPSALQDSNDSSEAAGAANLAAQSLQPSNLYAPIVDSAAVAPASSAVEAAPTAAMDARQIATGAPCEASAASILPSAPQNVTTRKHTCQNCRQSKVCMRLALARCHLDLADKVRQRISVQSMQAKKSAMRLSAGKPDDPRLMNFEHRFL